MQNLNHSHRVWVRGKIGHFSWEEVAPLPPSPDESLRYHHHHCCGGTFNQDWDPIVFVTA